MVGETIKRWLETLTGDALLSQVRQWRAMNHANRTEIYQRLGQDALTPRAREAYYERIRAGVRPAAAFEQICYEYWLDALTEPALRMLLQLEIQRREHLLTL